MLASGNAQFTLTGELDLEYLQRLHTVQVVDNAALTQKDARAQRALEIVDDASSEERKRVKADADVDFRGSIPPGELEA